MARSTKLRRSPASFADHLSQPRLFWRSLTPVEREHVVRAFTFELGKCYEQAIKERELQVLANVDGELCAQVAAGLGLPAPEPNQPAHQVTASPALSQLGRTWPPDGRTIGIVVDSDHLNGLRGLTGAITAAGMVPLIIAAHGGSLDDGLHAQRTFLTARSVEFDALLLAASPPPARDAPASRNGTGKPSPVDPRVVTMVEECFRHAKAIGGWGTAKAALEAAGATTGDPGVIVGDDPTEEFDDVVEHLGTHRVWERFPTTVS